MTREGDGVRYLSPLVKQDLAKLDADGDTRHLAVKSLKLFVEQLDAYTLPRFISQVAELRETGATRSYAISLYEEVARVHGRRVVPHIPKVMGALVRAAAASGSSPQLQVACARVTAALARHGIDSTTPQEDAEEIMRGICAPLVEALSGKLEPVAATAAACLHALVETAEWKYVPQTVVHEVCQRVTMALGEKATRTAAHMQLIRALASVSPDVLCLHGASLLRAGEAIFQATPNSWQLRKAAAQMLQSVLTILDKETLETELSSALHALDSCRLDKMPHVRAAVSEALHTAKMLASGHACFGADQSAWLYDELVSPASKRGTPTRARARGSLFSPRGASLSPRAASPTSQESRRLSFSPTSTSASEHSLHVPSPARSKRGPRGPPRYPARPGYALSSGTSPSSSTTTVEECQSPSRQLSEFRNGDGSPEEDEAGNGHVEVVLRRLKLMSNIGHHPAPHEHPTDDMTAASTDSQQTGSTIGSKAATTGSVQELMCDNRSATPEDEVVKREVATSRTESPRPSKQNHNAMAHLEVNLELDELMQDFPELVTPKRLVRSLSDLSIPEFGRSAVREQDEDLVVPATGLDAESATDAGWSVRDNPIATEATFRAESSDDDSAPGRGRAAYASSFPSPREIRMISPAPSPAPSPALSSASNEARSCDDGATSDPIRRESDHGPEPTLTACRIRYHGVKSLRASSGLSSLLLPDELATLSSCRVCETSPGNSSPKAEPRSEHGLMSFVSQKWRRIRWCAETALGGSLCLVIALPLAMIIVKALNGSRECHLVPT